MAAFEEHRNLDLKKIRGTTKQILPVRLRRGEDGLTKIVGHITANDEPFDLSGYTVRFAYINTDGGKFFRQAEITDATNGEVEYTVGRDLTRNEGTIKVAYFEINTPSGSVTSDTIPIMVERNADLTEEEQDSYNNDLDKLIQEFEQLVQDVYDQLEDVLKSEAQRKENENEREESEAERKANEQTRQQNETARQQAEAERAQAEQERENAETIRQANEENRETAESARDTAEQQRVRNENERIKNETARQQAEAERVEEFDRLKAESEQATKDAKTATDAVNKANEDYTEAEKQRVANENARKAYYENIQERVDNGDFNGATFTPHFEGTELNWTNDRGLDNPSPVDLKGERGSWWYLGTDVDKSGGDVDGSVDHDVYLNTETQDVFQKTDGLWIYHFTITGGGGGSTDVTLVITVEFTSTPKNGSQYMDGERVTFKTTLQNTSIVSLYELGVSVAPGFFDGGESSLEIDELRPGASTEYNGYYDVTEDSYGKTLSFHVMGGNALVQQNAYSAEIPVPIRDVQLKGTKTLTSEGTADEGKYYTWDTVTYDIDVTNEGNITLHNVELTEQLTGCTFENGSGYTVSDGKAKIDVMKPGASTKVAARYIIPETDLGRNNIINRVAIASDETNITASAQPFSVSDILRTLSIVKAITNEGTGADGKFQENDVIKYTITVENKGGRTFENVTVTEQLDGCIIKSGNGYTVSDGGKVANITNAMTQNTSVTINAEYTVSQADYSTNLINSVKTTSGDDINITTNAPAANVVERNVSLESSKTITTTGTGDNGQYYTYDTVAYDIDLNNNGNITLSNVKVTEQLDGCTIEQGSGYSVSQNAAIIETLLPGNSVKIKAAYLIAEVDAGKTNIINRAQVTSDQTTLKVIQASAFDVSSEIRTLVVTKEITSTGTGAGGVYVEGDVIRYTITVTNNGGKTFSGVTVEEQLSGCTITNGDGYTVQGNKAVITGDITQGRTVTINAEYTVSQSDYSTQIVNSVITKDDDAFSVTTKAKAAIPAARKVSIAGNKNITSVGTGDSGEYFTYDTVTYDIDVQNDGNITLNNIAVAELLDGCKLLSGSGYTLQGTNQANITQMLPGASVKIGASYQIPESDLGKASIVNSVTIDSDETESKTINAMAFSVSSELRALIAEITITNQGTGNGGVFVVGDTVIFNIAVTNKGALTYTNTTITEQLDRCIIQSGSGYTVESDGKVARIASISQNGVVNITAHFVITQADLGQTIINSIKADNDTIHITAESEPVNVDVVRRSVGITVTPENKGEGSGNGGNYFIGDDALYTVTVRNTGNVDLVNINLDSNLTPYDWEYVPPAPPRPEIPQTESDFQALTWEQVKELADDCAANGSEDYQSMLGWTREYTVSQGNVTLRLSSLNHKDKADGSGKAGFLFEATASPYSSVMYANATTASTWSTSSCRSMANGAVYNALPDDIKSVIVEVNNECFPEPVTTPQDNTNAQTTIVTDHIWIPSMYEIGVTNSNYGQEGKTFDWYVLHNTKDDMMKYGATNSKINWWTRTPVLNGGQYKYGYVNTTGNYSTYAANTTYYLTPCFCI